MVKIAFIGDVHGHIPEYLDLIKDCEYSIQLGDMGFDYSLLQDLNAMRHRFVPGNHENYPELVKLMSEGWQMPFDYRPSSIHPGCGWIRGYGRLFDAVFPERVFFIRGGLSIDQYRRTIGVDWFPEEEMTREELTNMCIGFNTPPDSRRRLVVSHECPAFLVSDYDDLRQGDLWKWSDKPFQPSRTSQAMEKAWVEAVIKPEIWVFGHHHCPMDRVVDGTRFICVPSLTKMELDF